MSVNNVTSDLMKNQNSSAPIGIQRRSSGVFQRTAPVFFFFVVFLSLSFRGKVKENLRSDAGGVEGDMLPFCLFFCEHQTCDKRRPLVPGVMKVT